MRAYFKQRALHSPDRVANLGEAFHETAEEKLKQIERAYIMLSDIVEVPTGEEDNG